MKNNKDNKSERVVVHVRMRPFSEEEIKKDNNTPIETFDTVNNQVIIKKDYDKKTFNFDSLLDIKIKQEDVFNKTAKSVVDYVIKGYNGTIFAYGQTGTGKTHTMVGEFSDKHNKGIIPRTFDYLFDQINNDNEFKYNIQLSFIQIYLETIQDLLEPSNENIRIREDPERGVYLEGVQWVKVKNPYECQSVFQNGEKNRVTASTKMNAHSSRSHAIIIVKIEKSYIINPDKISEITKESNDKILNERVMTKSMLFLVDLAGSERVKKTKAEAMRLEEAKKINYSLLVLGNCIQSLTDPKCSHVSYRDSKLTRLLQESLGGNAKTSLIVTISPSSYNMDETYGTLTFGSRAMKVTNKAIINKTVDYQALSIKLQDDLDKLNDEYTKLKIEYDQIYEENKKLKSSETYVDLQRKSIIIDFNSDRNEINGSTDIDEIEKRYTNEIKKLEKYYNDLIKNNEQDQERIFQDIDKVLYEKEFEIEELKKEVQSWKENCKNLKEILNDNDSEKEDYQKSIIELSNKNDELKRLNEDLTEKYSILKKEYDLVSKNKKNSNKKDSHFQTDNTIYREDIITYALDMKFIINSNDLINPSVLEKIIIFLKNENESIESNCENLQKELQLYRNKEKENINNLENLTKHINELTNNTKANEILKLDYEKRIEILNDNIKTLQSEKNNLEVNEKNILNQRLNEKIKENLELIEQTNLKNKEKEAMSLEYQIILNELEKTKKENNDLFKKSIETDIEENSKNNFYKTKFEDIKKSYDETINKFNSLNTEYNNYTENTNKTVFQLNESITLITSDKVILENKCKEYNLIIQDYKIENENNMKIIKENNSKIAEFNNRINQLNNEINNLNQVKTNLEQKCIEYKSILKQVESKKDEYISTITSLKLKNEELKKSIEEANIKYNSELKENLNLKDTNKKLNDEMNIKIKESIGFKNELDTSQKDNMNYINNLKCEKNNYLSQIKILNNKLDDLKYLNEEMNNTIKSQNKENRILEESINNYKSQIKDLELKNDEYYKQIISSDKINDDVKSLRIEKDTNEKKIKDLSYQLNNLKNDYEDLLKNYEVLKIEKNYQKLDRDIQTDLMLLKEDIIDIAKEIVDNGQNNSTIDIFEKLIKKLKTENLVYTEKLQNKDNDLKALEDKLSEITKMNEIIKNYKLEIDYLNKKIEETEHIYSEYESLKKENRNIVNQLHKYEDEKILVDITIDQLTKDNKRKEQELENLRIKNDDNSKSNLNERLNSLEKDKSDLTKTNKNLIMLIEEIKSNKEENSKLIDKLESENKNLNKLLSIDKLNSTSQTDNNSINEKILEIAEEIKILPSRQSHFDYKVYEKIILYYYNQINTINKLLEDKSKQCNLLIALQKENIKTMENVEIHKEHITDLTNKMKNYDKVKADLEKLKKERDLYLGENKKNKNLEANIEELKDVIKNYEDEIDIKKKTLEVINEGTFRIEEEKKNLISKLKDFDKVKEKDASTGIYLIRDYFNKTYSLMDELYRVMKSDE